MLRKFVVCMLFSALLVNAVGCSRGGDEKPPEKTKVRVGYLPSLAASSMYAAIANGYFVENGLDVEIQEVYSGPELINALQGKSVDVAFGIVPPLVLARARGLPVKSLVGATIDSKSVREHRIMLPVDSHIKQPEDLRGKRIAVVAEGTSDYFGLLQYLHKHGLSEADVEIIKTPHPDMIFALASRSVDAACGIEPFITMGKLSGKVRVFDYYYPDEPTEIGTFLVHEDLLAYRPEVAKRFRAAILKGNQYVRDQQKLRELLPQLERHGIKFKLSPEVARDVTIMEFRDTLTTAGVRKVMNELVSAGILKKPIDVQQCIYTPE